MSSFKIDTFTSKLSKGGALGSLFECELTNAKGSGSTIADFKFMCKGAVLPASTIEAGTVTYMGRALQIPGNRAAQQLNTDVYNDEGMEIRNHIENWMELINSHKGNARSSGMAAIGSYTGTLKVKQIAKEGVSITKSYEFIDAWPSSCAEVPLSWDTNDIQTFAVTWEYNYWKSSQSNVGFA
tara:strand:- start:90 stop:638 length:549 start_codon:yes stop_codon:yes gene_type:complete